jgi:vacuolar-type H+-ATPase catalytic subunit A/Vma1
MEFQLPEMVVEEIKVAAAKRGVTTTILMLEHLRDLGYSVTEADFTDLRKAPRR